MSFLGGALLVIGSRIGADARVLPRGNVGSQGSPLLLGPHGGATPASPKSGDNDDQGVDDGSNTDDNIETDSTSSITSSSTTSTSTSATKTSSTSTSTTNTSSSAISSTTSSPSSTASSPTPTHTTENRLLPSDPPKQPSSIRYLVPVFLLILITLAGFAYQKYRKRKKRRSRSSMAGKDFEKLMKNGNDPFANSSVDPNPYKGVGGGWKEIPSDEEDEVWDSRMDDAPQLVVDEEHNTVRLEGSRAPISTGATGTYERGPGGLIKSGQFISASEKGWGWRESWTNFRSARGKDLTLQNGFNSLSDLEEGEVDEKQTKTMKLVKSNKVSESITYTTLPMLGERDYQEVSIEDEVVSPGRGDEIRQLKDKLHSQTSQPDVTPRKNNKLERNKSPNIKRQSRNTTQVTPATAMPEAPEWIRPRSVSPTNLAILSPPMQPHLFFHPSPIPNKQIEPSIISEYSENGTICTSTSVGGTPEPSPNPNETKTEMKMPRIPSTASGLAGIDSFSVVSPSKTQSPMKKEKGYTPSGLNPTSPLSSKPNTKKDKSALPSKLTLKRSTALKNLSKPSPSPSKGKPSTLSPNAITGNNNKSSKKTRVEKKELKARNEVEDILKASWSDRALISPPLGSSTNQGFADQLRGVPGMMSPGLEQGGGGIEQRLALLKGVDI
ncbi:hypothetical protein I302_100762 [Kwoniella bestiolae CBS 10118]|uniref:Uncharacterized protein n=1 Tax=Kwoniella bestiolae CBS 10118 TaxID=1296100 RepID=A0A1B9G618_9TREE|nr:hypothetical protein I302_04135 [Kwoniella bestiolae CBS 10118]OCF26450.1 hypothetical protein I302_04135 [Kwoniella bestiolae CBS 10118]